MKYLRVWLVAAIAILSLSLNAKASTVKVSRWTPVFIGIDQANGSIDGNDASVAYALRVDLHAPGISFYTTPKQGTLNTIAAPTSQFLTKYGLQVAINANFFSPCCNAQAEDKTIMGLAVSDANVVSAPDGTPGQNASLLISRKNTASIAETNDNTDLSDVFNAVTGSGIIVQDGVNVGAQTPYGDGADPNPRTVIGMSQDGRYLYLVVIDGRQPGYSVGTTHTESADILLALGAYTAINLDGGGSTDMVEDNGHGGAKIINRPSGGAERFDANQLGIRALPLPPSSGGHDR
jgi:exopolysaccharide biosynthesis protein